MDKTKARDYYFDNAKFILSLLVVLGHAIEPLISKSGNLKFLYIFIYMFHMPAFALISGYFSRKYSPKKALKTIIIPYVLFQTAYIFFSKFILGANTALTLTTPYWIMWYLMSLLIWNVILPYISLAKHPLILSIVIAILAGYDNNIGYYLSLSRTLTFLPFFLAGYYGSKTSFEKLFNFKVRAPLLALAAIITYTIFNFYGKIDVRWLYGSYSYKQIGVSGISGGFLRMTAYLAAAVMTAAFFSVVPDMKTFYSFLGSRTMKIYIFHGFIIRYLVKAGIYSRLDDSTLFLSILYLSLTVAMILSIPRIKSISYTKYAKKLLLGMGISIN